jgi:hypothetical protein
MPGSGHTARHIPVLVLKDFMFVLYVVRFIAEVPLVCQKWFYWMKEMGQTSGGELVYCNFRNGLYGATEEAGNFI